MTLRESIEARRVELLEERAIAEAATPGPWVVTSSGSYVATLAENLGDRLGGVCRVEEWTFEQQDADAAHIARQDPASTLARVDRELRGIDADLALLDNMDQNWLRRSPVIEANLCERYEGDA